MKKERRKLAFELLVLFLVLFFIVASFSYDRRAKLMPLLVGFSTLVLVLVLLVNRIHPVSIIGKIDVDWTENLRLQELSQEREKEVGPKRFLLIVLWIFGFFLSILLFGFYISIALFTFAFLRFQGKVSHTKALLAAVLTWAAVLAIFEWAMGFGLFEGLLFGAILPPL